MMSKSKVIYDIVHGYVDVECSMEKIINDPSFQRLKDISQMTAQHLFPSVNHTRFEHSLGVFKLSTEVFARIRKDLLELTSQTDRSQDPILKKHSENKTQHCDIEQFILFLEKHLYFAALLHDVGHMPFSHLGESFIDKESVISEIQQECASVDIPLSKSTIFDCGARHEVMSCYVILKNFLKYKEDYFGSCSFDLEFIFRIIVGNKYSGEEFWARNIMIEMINSSTIDVDKLDYLMRDNHMTGYAAPKIDIERLFLSVGIDPDTRTLIYWSKGLSAVQSIIECRDNLYLWIYNHHTVVYTDYLIHDLIKHLSSDSGCKEQEKIDLTDFFSTRAVISDYVSDSDLKYHFKKLYSNLGHGDTISKYTKTLLPQLYERNFLKPLWKTLSEYGHFIKHDIKNRAYLDEKVKSISDLNNRGFRAQIVRQIRKRCSLNGGDIFLIVRSNKFYSLSNSQFYVAFNQSGETHIKNVKDLLPQKKYDEYFDNVGFYLFARQDKVSEVKQAFIDIMSGR